MQTAIIFGVLGQAGIMLTELLLAKNYRVIGVRRRCSRPDLSRIKKYLNGGNFKLIEGDVTDSFSVDHIISGAVNDAEGKIVEIYNCSAQSHVHTSFNQPAYTMLVNYNGVLNILEVMRKYPEHTKLLQCSTSEMYGDNYDTKEDFSDYDWTQNKPVETDKRIKYQNENTRFSPMSPYAVSKVASHYLVNNYRKAYNLHASCAINFNFESKYRGDEFVTKKVCNYVNYLRQELCFGLDKTQIKKLKLGNLDSYRDFTYCGDTVYAWWLMLQQDIPDDYVVCTGQTIKIEEFVDKAFKYIGQNWQEWVDIDDTLKRPSEVDYLRGDNSKITQKLRWSRSLDLDGIIKQMVEYASV